MTAPRHVSVAILSLAAIPSLANAQLVEPVALRCSNCCAAHTVLAASKEQWYEFNEVYADLLPGSPINGITTDGQYLWVAHGGASVRKLDLRTGAEVAQVGGLCNGTVRLVFDGQHIWATTSWNQVAKIDANNSSFVGCYSVGLNPVDIEFDGKSIWVANQTGGSVTHLAIDGTPIATIPIGNQSISQPIELAFDGKSIWVTAFGEDYIYRINATTHTVTGPFPGGNGPHGILYDGRSIWVSSSLDGNLLRLSPKTGNVLQTIPVGNGPRALAFDGRAIWVANVNGNNLVKVHACNGKVLGTAPVAAQPVDLVFDGDKMWIAHAAGKVLMRR